MAFLKKKEQSMINVINSKTDLPEASRKALIEEIKYNARLRSDRYRPKVKVFLSVLTNIKNEAIAEALAR